MSEAPKFSFGGTPASSSAPSSNLFGNTSGSTLFGSGSNTPSGGGLFGSAGGSAGGDNKGAAPTFSFGNLGQKPAETKDEAPKQNTFNFGTPAKPPTTTQASGLFGNAGSSTGTAPTFGSTTPAPNKPSTGFSFGSTTPAGPPPSSSAGGASAGSLFGGLGGPKPSTASTPSLFGQKPSEAPTTTSAAPSSGLFGSNPAPSGPSLFGQPPASSGASIPSQFGNAGKSAEAPKPSGTSNLFGNVGGASAASIPSTTSAAPSASQPTSALFGAKPNETPASSATQPPSTLFSAKPSSTPAAAPSFSFSKPAANPAEQKPAEAPKPAFSGFGPTSSAPTSNAASTSAPPSGGLFGGLNKSSAAPSSSTPAPSGGLFGGLGQQTTTSAPSASAATTSATSAPSLFAPKPTTSTATDAGSKTATPATSAVPAGTTASTSTTTASGPSAPTTNLNASITGPLPPSQSRLKNKTMDEIITRWATDLTKYQKEFQAQAEQVATWDQILVENMAKISKLYVATATAEKQTSSVEMQLTAVENQQDELSSWLDRYEKEVDDMMGKGIGGDGALQGVDQERERTYKLAEKLSDRLEDMGKDLTTMIEDINTASASLSKQTKSDEPISQIVRILNSHLTQLQAIGQGTSALQAKIATAQKAGRDLSGYGNGYGGAGNQAGAVDDFYRSFMGRR